MCIFSAGVALIISALLFGVAAVAAAVLAYMALMAWQKQFRRSSERRIAIDVLKAVYRVREAFRYARDPVILFYEFPVNMRSPLGDLLPEMEYDGFAWVYKKRLEKIDSSFRELEELHLQAQAEWGPDVQDRLEKLRYCRHVLFRAIDDMLWEKKELDRPKMSADELLENRSIIYKGDGGHDDQLTSQIDESVSEFESWLRPIISAEG